MYVFLVKSAFTCSVKKCALREFRFRGMEVQGSEEAEPEHSNRKIKLLIPN